METNENNIAKKTLRAITDLYLKLGFSVIPDSIAQHAFFDYSDIPAKDINKEPSIIVKSRGVIEFEYYDKPFSHKNEMWSYHSKDKNISILFFKLLCFAIISA